MTPPEPDSELPDVYEVWLTRYLPSNPLPELRCNTMSRFMWGTQALPPVPLAKYTQPRIHGYEYNSGLFFSADFRP